MCKFEWETQFPLVVLHLTVLELNLNRTSIFKDVNRVYNIDNKGKSNVVERINMAQAIKVKSE